MLQAMGFSGEQAALALKATSNNLERAADWIFSHQHELDSLLAASRGQAPEQAAHPAAPTYKDGPSR